jgi:hypothetical protein
MSKVVRIDYPLDWPDVLTNLVRVLRTVNYSNQQHPRRGMLITQQIIKELSTTRLRISQTHLHSVTSGIDVAMLMPRYISQRRGAIILSVGLQGSCILFLNPDRFNFTIGGRRRLF